MSTSEYGSRWKAGVAVATILMLGLNSTGRSDESPESWPVVFSEDFESETTDRWEASDAKAWKLVKQDDNQVFEQFAQSKVETPVRSPFNRAIAKGVTVSDFQFDVDLQSTARDYPHRSLCLFFGYQDQSHMYYVHFGQATDDHANQIFIVNDAPRKKISTKTTDGTPWNNEWHHARIIRRTAEGTIEVYFDDMTKPVMTAVDKTFVWGQIGIGSFDDTGRFDKIEIRGIEVDSPKQ